MQGKTGPAGGRLARRLIGSKSGRYGNLTMRSGHESTGASFIPSGDHAQK